MSLNWNILLVIGLALTCHIHVLPAQNLVPNPSFEGHDECPGTGHYEGQIIHAVPWFTPNESYGPGGSSDYFNACSDSTAYGVPLSNYGFQQARSGNAYAGIAIVGREGNNYREYIEVKLTDSLSEGIRYYCEFFVSAVPEAYRFGIDRIGAHLSEDSLSVSNWMPLNVSADIENSSGVVLNDTQWVMISGHFIADGGEQYLTIGNFNDDQSTTYQVIPFGGLSGNSAAYYFIDDVVVIPDSLTTVSDIGANRVKIWPNPSSLIVQMQFIGSTEYVSVEDIHGRLILGLKPNQLKLEVDVSSWSAGMYLIRLMDDSGNLFVERFIVQH